MKHNTAKVRGFTLIEILVSLIILSGGLLAVAKFQVFVLQSGTDSKQRTEAVLLGQQKLELLRSFVQIAACSGCSNYSANITNGSDTASGRNAVFTRTWTVTTSTNPAYKTVEMKVTWADMHGVTQTVVLNSRITNADPAGSGNLVLLSGGYGPAPSEHENENDHGNDHAHSDDSGAHHDSTPAPDGASPTEIGASPVPGSPAVASRTIQGSIQAGDGNPNMTQPTVTGSTGASCALSYDGNNVAGYSCTVANGWTGTITANGGAGNGAATSPPSYSFTVIASAQTGKNFIVTR